MSYFNPMDFLYQDSMVDHGLGKMFSSEFIGIREGEGNLSTVGEMMLKN